MQINENTSKYNNDFMIDPDDERDNVFVDMDGTEIMMTKPTLWGALSMSLHPRLGRNSLLGLLDRDIVKIITTMTHELLIEENLSALFQVFGQKIRVMLPGLNVNSNPVSLDVSRNQIELFNSFNHSYFSILFDENSPTLTVTMGEVSFFHPFMINADGSRMGNAYHTLCGDVVTGFELVADISGSNYYSKCIPFPENAPVTRKLIEAVIPDVSREVRRLSSKSFAVVARKLRAKYAERGLTARIITTNPITPGDVIEQSLVINQIDTFNITVNYDGNVMDIYLHPSDVFAPNMEPEPDRRKRFRLSHTDTNGLMRFHDFSYSRTQDHYELNNVSTEREAMDVLPKLVDAAVEIGSGYSRSTMSTNNKCPHCGRAMGEGIMQGTPCIQCERMGRRPV
jgi:hypothetical protein